MKNNHDKKMQGSRETVWFPLETKFLRPLAC